MKSLSLPPLLYLLTVALVLNGPDYYAVTPLHISWLSILQFTLHEARMLLRETTPLRAQRNRSRSHADGQTHAGVIISIYCLLLWQRSLRPRVRIAVEQ
jgi:hypothetical protein